MPYRGTPPKMTTSEYKARASRLATGQTPPEHVLLALGITASGATRACPRSQWHHAVYTTLRTSKFTLAPLNLKNECSPGYPVTLAVLAASHLHTDGGKWLVFTAGDIIVFNDGLVWDTAAEEAPRLHWKCTVKRRVTAAYQLTGPADHPCDCSDPLVFGQCERCPRWLSAPARIEG